MNLERTRISLMLVCLVAMSLAQSRGKDFYISPEGNDTNAGTLEQPFATLAHAQAVAREIAGKEAVNVFIRGGTYYLPETLIFTAQDSGTREAPVVYQAYQTEQPVISGGVKLNLKWEPYTNGIFQAQAPADLKTEEIFVNGEREVLARYPNFDPAAKYFDGYAPDAISPERASRWADPAGGYFHAMHPSLWGDFTWRITGKDTNGQVTLEGGWQNNRGGGKPHATYRFVENIFEELDAPREWYLNSKTHVLYYYPPAGLELRTATVEATRLRSLIEFQGDEQKPVRFVTLRGLTFRQAARTVMDTKEPLLRTDWAIYRGGAVFFNGAEDCTVEDSLLDQLGGNAIFVNNYDRRIVIRGCHIIKAGANGVCFVGDPNAARNPLFNYGQRNKLEDIDRTPGPKTDNYPADCLVEDCLIHETGRVEKQTAGVEIDLAQSITVRHCSIYDVPRAGINIGDGCWGGHIIEFCDVFDTVKETGDHGSFNSWGRDRYWLPNLNVVDAWVKQVPAFPLLDVVKPIILRNNRWRCDHGWDIDLDDGSSNYKIYNNLCLKGGLKNREGYQRDVENNILVDNTYFPQCWFANSGDIFRRNIVWTGYRPARMYRPPWGREMDDNFVQSPDATNVIAATDLQKQSGRDEHSLAGDAMFVDPLKGDYRVKDGSPALLLGFTNFPMDQFGVQKASLKAIARTPEFSNSPKVIPVQSSNRDDKVVDWLQAKVRNIAGQAEMSAYGTPGETGVLVLDVSAGSVLERAGLRKDDVVIACDGKKIDTANDLPRFTAGAGRILELNVLRNQIIRVIAL